MSGARPDTWMPVYIGDYLADTMHLSYAEHGAYLLLIFAYWRNGKPLTDDNEELASICRAGSKDWTKLRMRLSRFFEVGDGVWRHRRVEKELTRCQEISAERSKAGAIGAAKRWQADSKRIASDIAEPLANPCYPQSQSHSLSNEREKNLSPISPEFDEFWTSYPKHLARKKAEKAHQAALKRNTHDEIMVGLKGYTFPTDPQFIPYAASWLNGERWKDEAASRVVDTGYRPMGSGAGG